MHSAECGKRNFPCLAQRPHLSVKRSVRNQPTERHPCPLFSGRMQGAEGAHRLSMPAPAESSSCLPERWSSVRSRHRCDRPSREDVPHSLMSLHCCGPQRGPPSAAGYRSLWVLGPLCPDTQLNSSSCRPPSCSSHTPAWGWGGCIWLKALRPDPETPECFSRLLPTLPRPRDKLSCLSAAVNMAPACHVCSEELRGPGTRLMSAFSTCSLLQPSTGAMRAICWAAEGLRRGHEVTGNTRENQQLLSILNYHPPSLAITLIVITIIVTDRLTYGFLY